MMVAIRRRVDSSSKPMTRASTSRARDGEPMNHPLLLISGAKPCHLSRIWRRDTSEGIKRIQHLAQDTLIPRIEAHHRASPSQRRINSNQAIRWL